MKNGLINRKEETSFSLRKKQYIRKIVHVILSILLLLLHIACSTPQEPRYKISGTVTDQYGEWIENVEVIPEDTIEDYPVQTTPIGSYCFMSTRDLGTDGEIIIKFEKEGYTKRFVYIKIEKNKILTLMMLTNRPF